MKDDLIKRSDAVGIVQKRLDTPYMQNAWQQGACLSILRAIEELPSADRPQGEWKPKNHHTDYCSNCGFEETQWRTADYNFCPSCGARMKGADDD